MFYNKCCLLSAETLCDLPQLPPDVTGSPWKLTYNIGEAVSLSCPEEKVREGPAEIQCNAGLSWSPQPTETRCLTGTKLVWKLCCFVHNVKMKEMIHITQTL